MFADEAHRMCLVDQYQRAIFLRNADHFLQRRDVAEHRIDALEHDEFARFGGQALEALFERLDVIVAEGDDFGVAHRAAVIDRRVAVDVEADRSEEHTSELQSLIRISYAVFCLKKKIRLPTTR